MTIRVWSTSAGLDPGDLVAGRDLVLDLDPRHGVDLARGIYVMDALPAAERFEVDHLAAQALDRWRADIDSELTLDAVPWAWIWELDLFEIVNPAVAAAYALRAALRDLGASTAEVMDVDPRGELLVRAVGRDLGIEVLRAPGAVSLRPTPGPQHRLPLWRRLRRLAFNSAAHLGTPTLLRRDSLLIRSYWPLTDVVDRLIDRPDARPALSLQNRPSGAWRQLRTALKGGWLGSPTPLDRRRAARLLPAARAAIDAGPGLVADGLQLGAVVRPDFRALAERRLTADAALARSVRRGLRRRPPARLLGRSDAEPSERLVGMLAREAGIPSLLIAHGAYLLPSELRDLEHCEEAIVWSRAVAPTMTWREGRVHVVGYPLTHSPPPVRSPAPPTSPVVAVLGQLGVETTCTIDKRVTAESYTTAIEAVLARFPDGKVVLRPAPGRGPGNARTAPRALRLVPSEHRRRDPDRGAVCAGRPGARRHVHSDLAGRARRDPRGGAQPDRLRVALAAGWSDIGAGGSLPAGAGRGAGRLRGAGHAPGSRRPAGRPRC